MMKQKGWFMVGLLVALIFTTGCLHNQKKKDKKDASLRIFLQTSPVMPENLRYQILFDKPNITFWVKSLPELTEQDVASAETVSTGGGLQIKLQFNHHGSFILEQLTGSNRGKYLAVVIDAHPVAPILIQEIYRNGELIFTPNLTDLQTTDVITRLQHTLSVIRRDENMGITP